MSLPPYLVAGENTVFVATWAALLSPFITVWALFDRKIEDIHYISLIIATSTTLLANMCVGANLGWTLAIYSDHPVCYTRYISYIIYAPPVLLCLLKFTHANKVQTFSPFFTHPFSVLFSLGGALLSGLPNCGFYLIGVFLHLPLALILLILFPPIGFRDERYRPLYFRGVKYMLFIWTIYSIYRPLPEEIRSFPPFLDMVLGGVLDFASGPGLIWLLIRWFKQLDFEVVQEVATTETKTEMKQSMV